MTLVGLTVSGAFPKQTGKEKEQTERSQQRDEPIELRPGSNLITFACVWTRYALLYLLSNFN